MKKLILLISLFSLSTFAAQFDTSSLDASLEEISISLENASCSELYGQITGAYVGLGKIMGMVELTLEIDPNADVGEAQAMIKEYQAQLNQVDNEYKPVCLK